MPKIELARNVTLEAQGMVQARGGYSCLNVTGGSTRVAHNAGKVQARSVTVAASSATILTVL